ncbi:hypothetical protein GWI33_018591 [Rhynchophorus ferrugineus]|uniref:Uncharacterized protein n=1 Tax=Rhynchophorus ferrugineus TaxID=354439 RepID=A0A834I715_RHYFE|nr:hypothetical protein GWI33_018591 [Rhynchophorus ferrugineus]
MRSDVPFRDYTERPIVADICPAGPGAHLLRQTPFPRRVPRRNGALSSACGMLSRYVEQKGIGEGCSVAGKR